MTYLTPCQWRPIIGHIDLFSPLWKYPFICYTWTQKVLHTMGIVFTCHPLLLWWWMEISIHTHGLEAICGHGEYLYRTHPLNIPYMDNPRSRLTTDLDGRPRLIHRLGPKVKAIAIYGKTCAFGRSRMVTWPPLACLPLTLNLIWKFVEAIPHLCHSVWQTICFKI